MPTDGQAAFLAAEYAESGQPLYWALGIGVCGPTACSRTTTALPRRGDGKGVDLLEQSGIFSALLAAGAACGIEIE